MDKEAIAYLKNVLAEWQIFCKTHSRFANAIEEVLKEKVTCSQCKKRDTVNCPLYYGEVNRMRFFTRFAKQDDFWCKEGEPK